MSSECAGQSVRHFFIDDGARVVGWGWKGADLAPRAVVGEHPVHVTEYKKANGEVGEASGPAGGHPRRDHRRQPDQLCRSSARLGLVTQNVRRPRYSGCLSILSAPAYVRVALTPQGERHDVADWLRVPYAAASAGARSGVCPEAAWCERSGGSSVQGNSPSKPGSLRCR